jgi:predicted RNA methylase
VLIPRPETELLVDLALERCRPASASVLDLGTGSGAIALAIKRNRPRARVVAVEIGGDRARIRKAQRGEAGLEIELLHGAGSSRAGERFDLVVSNPPYVALEDPHLTRAICASSRATRSSRRRWARRDPRHRAQRPRSWRRRLAAAGARSRAGRRRAGASAAPDSKQCRPGRTSPELPRATGGKLKSD